MSLTTEDIRRAGVMEAWSIRRLDRALRKNAAHLMEGEDVTDEPELLDDEAPDDGEEPETPPESPDDDPVDD